MKAITDIETGGFSKEKNGLCEIGMIAINENNIEVDSLSMLIKPYEKPLHLQDFKNQLVSYKDSAMSVNGLTVGELINDGVDARKACEMIVEFITKNNITSFIGHNIESFDKKWLLYFFSRFSSYDLTELSVTECTMKIAKDKLSLKSYSLGSLCEYFNVINDDSHRAIGDCRATLDIYKQLI